MKKLFITLCVTFVVFVMHAVNQISLSSVVGHPLDVVQVDVLLKNSEDIAALEIVIPLDVNMAYVNESIELNEARSNGHTISAAEVDKELRIYIYNLSLQPIVGRDGLLCSFNLKLKKEPAVYTLKPNVVLSSATGSVIDAEIISGNVTISAPKLEIETKNVDFGYIPIRSTYTQNFVLRNVGNLALNVTSVDIDDEDFAFSETAFVIGVGESKTLTLQYNPVNWGEISRTVTVMSNAVNGTQTANVVAEPFSVNELLVEQVQGFVDSIVFLPIKMNNMEPIVSAKFSLVLPSELVYEGVELSDRAANHIVKSIMSDDTLTVVVYSSSNVAAMSGEDGVICNIKLRLGGSNTRYYLMPQDVELSNSSSRNMTTGVYGEYVVVQCQEMDGDDNLIFAKSSIVDKVQAGYSIHNIGKLPLIIDTITFLDEGYVVLEELPIVVDTGKTHIVKVEYIPTSEGYFSTTMQIHTNDPKNRVKDVAIRGEIYEPNTLSLSGLNVEDGYEVKVAMDNYSNIVAMQFDIHWLDGMISDNSLLKTTSRAEGHTCSIRKISNGHYRVFVSTPYGSSIIGHEGDVMSIVFGGLSPEQYNETFITVDNVILSDRNGVNKSSFLGTSLNVKLYKLTVTVNDVNKGRVEYDMYQSYGVEATLTPIPAEGCYFVGWLDGDTASTRRVIVTSDSIFTAEFAIYVHTVTLSAEKGTVTGAGKYDYGTVVTLVATPIEGYHFERWSDGDTTSTRTIVVTSDISLTAVFAINVYTVTLLAENGAVTGAGKYEHGAVATIEAIPSEGYHFEGWSNGDTASMCIFLVTSDISLTAEFAINVYTVTLSAENGTVMGAGEYEHGDIATITALPISGYHFVGWSDGDTTSTRIIVVTSDMTLTAEFAINVYSVTLLAENGTVTGAGKYDYGTAVTLIATPAEGYRFVRWSDGVVNATRSIILTSDTILTAEFASNICTITLLAENGTVTGAGKYDYGTEVTLTATPAEGYHFVRWSDGDVNATRSIAVTSDITLTAEFAINIYTVNLIAENGIVTGSGDYQYGAIAHITATPTEGFHFVKWSDGDTNASRSITVTSDTTFTAEFAINTYTVTLIAENGVVIGFGKYLYGAAANIVAMPAEGYHFVKWSDGDTRATRSIRVTSDITLTAEFAINVYVVTLIAEKGIVTGSGEYQYGSTAHITVTPAEGHYFVKWSDGDTHATRNIIVTSDTTLTAEFGVNDYMVVLSAENGTVTGYGKYQYGATAQISATPAQGYHFVKWSDGDTNATRSIIVTSDVNLTAEFAIDVYVVKLIAENGVVTGSGEYHYAHKVYITATPAEGYHFVKWSDGDTNMARSITVTSDTTLIAEFVANVYKVKLSATNGTVIGAGDYTYGSIANIVATPAEGYHFVRWSDGDTASTRMLVITSDITLTAEFAINVYTITLSGQNGTVVGAGKYQHGDVATITAMPAEGYHFVRWSDGDTASMRIFVVTSDIALTAEFAINVYTITLSGQNGTVVGAGKYQHGDVATITAMPAEGYHFVRWSDGDTASMRIFVVTSDITLTAEFAANVYSVTLSAEHGTVKGSGEYHYGEIAVITAIPAEGYHFVGWSDGDTTLTRMFIVTSDVTLVAEFAINVYTVTLSGQNGTVVGAGKYNHGTEVSISAIPDKGYHFLRWSDGDTTLTRTFVLTSDITLVAEFELDMRVGEETVRKQSLVVYSQNQNLYVEGATDNYYVIDTAGRVIYIGQSTVITLPYGVYLVVSNGETHKIAIR